MDHVRRTRDVYGQSAELYVASIGTAVSPHFEAPSDREVLERFARRVVPDRLVLDAGCGPGRIARFLADRGIAAVGVDVAPGMVEAAAAAHPDLGFALAELTGLPVRTGALGGVVSWYSIITTPPVLLSTIWSEFARVLAPGGLALVAFQSGRGDAVERPAAFGTDVDLTLYRHDPEWVARTLAQSSFEVLDVVEREPEFGHETGPQAFVVVRSAGGSARGQASSDW